MKSYEGFGVLITGGGSGIGRALALHFAKCGAFLSLLDFSLVNGKETVRLIEEQDRNLPRSKPLQPRATFSKCDVTDSEQLSSAFEKHLQSYGRLDICINNAGIGDSHWFADDKSTNGKGLWRQVIDVNLTAVIDGTRLAVRAMNAKKQPGVIINIASAAGLYPSPNGPVYSASKGGVVLFTRSLAHLNRTGIRVNALCPEYIETPLISQVTGQAAKHLPSVLKILGGYIPMETIIEGVLELIQDESKSGECLWISNRLGKQYWPTEEEKKRYLTPADSQKTKTSKTEQNGRTDLPKEIQKIIVHKLSTDFRAATKIIRLPLNLPLPKGTVLLKYLYVGINASDINYSAGRYFGSPEAAAKLLPFDAGFEGVGLVAAVGEGVKIKLGSPVATMSYGAFSDYCQVEAKLLIPVPEASREMVAMLTSGLTASIGLEEAGKMGFGETVLVTAAAGGTGQFAVQLAKLKGNRVVATCGGKEKAELLKRLGVDRVIDYKEENVGKVLKEEYPDGVNLIYESVGGKMFQTCINALSRFGRCVVIGMMSQYTSGENKDWAPSPSPGLTEKLLWKSQSLTGFFLPHYTPHWKRHLAKLHTLHTSGLLQVSVDSRQFFGLESVSEAVEYLHSGKSIGKVVVQLSNDGSFGKISKL